MDKSINAVPSLSFIDSREHSNKMIVGYDYGDLWMLEIKDDITSLECLRIQYMMVIAPSQRQPICWGDYIRQHKLERHFKHIPKRNVDALNEEVRKWDSGEIRPTDPGWVDAPHAIPRRKDA